MTKLFAYDPVNQCCDCRSYEKIIVINDFEMGTCSDIDSEHLNHIFLADHTACMLFTELE